MRTLADSGRYCLIIRLDRRVQLKVGRLGPVEFRPGIYVYTGSAAGGLRARVARHQRKHKRKHWHIDHLLASQHASITTLILVTDMKMSECEINQRVMRLAGGNIPAFGSSDCPSGCGSHLAYFGSESKLVRLFLAAAKSAPGWKVVELT